MHYSLLSIPSPGRVVWTVYCTIHLLCIGAKRGGGGEERTEETGVANIDRCPELSVNLITLGDNSWQSICKLCGDRCTQATRRLLMPGVNSLVQPGVPSLAVGMVAQGWLGLQPSSYSF